jgi:hypothetical protein
MPVELSPQALATVEQVKRQIPSRAQSDADDNTLADLINAVSGDIYDYTGREFIAYDADRATLTTAIAGAHNDLVFTARELGLEGNDTSIEYVVPAPNHALELAVDGDALTVTLATDADGNVTTTAAQLAAAIGADSGASALVVVADAEANDGSGLLTALPKTHLAGGNPQTRSFELASSGSKLAVGDLARLESLSGTSGAIDTSTVVPRPLVRKPWEPIRVLALTSAYRAGSLFQVSGDFGFPFVPDPIRQVCKENVAARFLRDVARFSETFSDQEGRVILPRGFLRQSYETLDRFRLRSTPRTGLSVVRFRCP